ncbi:DUF2490 domain-containing protein [Parachryseolinea silvisoli]|uniref:DUF2490 domain-containing protein n=1 Tax=Parachryseolinea silvisoli TaxID=2873601 RepID=UPI002265AB82|nr:DUF2490 domain-containing protein [Parachryseolinea silvisoli]MCD9017161.1 DUF2490 domain-containing protein [Parachryseolinea silvisoli]
MQPKISQPLFLFVLAIAGHFAAAQSIQKEVHHREQLWLGFFNQTRLTDKFGFWVDVHYRQTGTFIDRPFQFIFRPAVTYFIKDNLRINVGYAFVNHFPAKGLGTSRPEHRVWQQIWWNQKYPGLTTLQWLRLEERFNHKIANDQLLDGYNFNYRLRYNLSFFIPLLGKELAPKTPFIAVMNEVFINFGGKIVYNTFDQNRFFAGLGYQFTPHLNAQLGYMNAFQQEATGNNYISTNAIRLFFFHSLDVRPKDE